MQLREGNLALEDKKLNFAIGGVINKKLPQREFPSQNTPLHNFLTTQPLHTNSNSIDAARQAEYDAKLKNKKKFQSTGAIFTKFPQREFLSEKSRCCHAMPRVMSMTTPSTNPTA